MREAYGTHPGTCLAAIGPCICAERYEVGPDVADKFRNAPGGFDAGSALPVMPKNEFTGTYSLNLRQVVYGQLIAAGIRVDYVSVSDECTFEQQAGLLLAPARRGNGAGRDGTHGGGHRTAPLFRAIRLARRLMRAIHTSVPARP